ncbi:hypothetical protein F5141DRAFT_150868 [Pisolithus sp. B1]|nr:hypothetical protein F5141DRAFT_150868 [Pisolithus sp. B1]KAI6134961.1 hypothetical protein EV401DRAFT_869027 [Pisolithus croceorrhizus]
MSFLRSNSPPPPLPSPQLVPIALPSPPPLSKKSSRTRLAQQHSPIHAAFIGDSLVPKTLVSSRSYDCLDRRARASLFGDDDDFGTGKPSLHRRLPTRTSKHITDHPSPRCRSPPPSTTVVSPPPPVPPIPTFMLAPTDKKSVLQPVHKQSIAHQAVYDRYTRHRIDERLPHSSRKYCEPAPNPITCMRPFSMHHPRRDCEV